MPDQITTAAELSGYPLGAVFTDIEGGVWMIDSRNPATRAVLALIPPQRCAPSEDELANVLRDILVRVFEQDKDIVAQDAARAVLALFSERRCAPSGDEIRNILHLSLIHI